MGPFAWRSRFPKTLRGKAAVNPLDSGQPSIPTGERSGLLTHITTTVSVSLCERDEKLTAFLDLESAISDCQSVNQNESIAPATRHLGAGASDVQHLSPCALATTSGRVLPCQRHLRSLIRNKVFVDRCPPGHAGDTDRRSSLIRTSR